MNIWVYLLNSFYNFKSQSNPFKNVKLSFERTDLLETILWMNVKRIANPILNLTKTNRIRYKYNNNKDRHHWCRPFVWHWKETTQMMMVIIIGNKQNSCLYVCNVHSLQIHFSRLVLNGRCVKPILFRYIGMIGKVLNEFYNMSRIVAVRLSYFKKK